MKRSILFILLLTAFMAQCLYASPTRTLNSKRDVVALPNNDDWSKTTTTATTATPTSAPQYTPPASGSSTAIYGGTGITSQNGVCGAGLIVLGLYLMVFGFRSFRITLAVSGFLTFALISWVAMANNEPYYGYMNNDITLIAVPAGLGILGAIIYALFWNISIYLVGALGGFALSLYILCCKDTLVITQVVARAAFVIALPFFFSFITFFAEKYVLLFSFSFVGSYCFMVGIEFLAHTGYLAGIKTILDGNPYHKVIYTISHNVVVLIVFVIIMFLISFAWQYMYNRNMRFGVFVVDVVEVPREEKPESPKEEHKKEGESEAAKKEEHVDK